MVRPSGQIHKYHFVINFTRKRNVLSFSTDSAIRSAYMALNNHGITAVEGFVAKTAEETIHDLNKSSKIGMVKVDGTMLEIIMDKDL